ncbi:MAG: hypothetical protein LLG13_13395 [Bacteroidales bacterium]|nr:hypothetical protein [Bacteroidales bacterium]
MKKLISITFVIAMLSTIAFSQDSRTNERGSARDDVPYHKFSVSTTYLTFLNFGPEEQNIHMCEFHFGYKITPKDKIEIKVASWELFEPMGIPWGPYKMQESEAYPGRLKESGIGLTYQRLLWKGLFAQIEILPLWKTYLDEDKEKIDDGFKLYTSYHIGYHIPLLKNRFFIEPQVHCNYWPFDTKGPAGFEEKESKCNNYFLFEPNLYIGVNF